MGFTLHSLHASGTYEYSLERHCTYSSCLLFYCSCISRLYKLVAVQKSLFIQQPITYKTSTEVKLKIRMNGRMIKDSHSFHKIHHTVIIIITGTFYSEIRRPVEEDQLPLHLSSSGASQNTQALPARHLIQMKITNLIGLVSRETAVLKY